MITNHYREILRAAAPYEWVAMNGRMLYSATYDKKRGVQGFLEDLAFPGIELVNVTESKGELIVTWEERTVRLWPGDTLNISPPVLPPRQACW